MRWVDNDHEYFTNAIKDVLIRMDLSLTQCRGQFYDGASNMSGSRSGVAARLLLEEKRAVYTHCYAHALNLAIGNTLKWSKICCEAMEVACEITKLIKFSPKRNAAYDKIKAEESCDDLKSRVGIRSI